MKAISLIGFAVSLTALFLVLRLRRQLGFLDHPAEFLSRVEQRTLALLQEFYA